MPKAVRNENREQSFAGNANYRETAIRYALVILLCEHLRRRIADRRTGNADQNRGPQSTSASDASENVSARRLAYCKDRRMGEPALSRDCVEMLDHGVYATDFDNFVLLADMISDRGWRNEQAGPGLAK